MPYWKPCSASNKHAGDTHKHKDNKQHVIYARPVFRDVTVSAVHKSLKMHIISGNISVSVTILILQDRIWAITFFFLY